MGGSQDREAKPKMSRGSSFKKAKEWLNGRSRAQEEDDYSDDYTDEEGEPGGAVGDRSGAAGGGAQVYGQNTSAYAGNPNALNVDKYSEQGSKLKRGGTFKKAKEWLNGRSRNQEEDYYSDDYTEEEEQGVDVGGSKYTGGPGGGGGRGGFH